MVKNGALIPCVLWLVLHVSHCFFLTTSYLEPSPNERHELVGTNFTLSCTITSQSLVDSGCDASHIYFRNSTSVQPSDMVEVQNNYTAILTINHAKRQYQSYYCHFYENSSACDESMGSFHVVVIKHLEPSRDFRCVLDSWLNMTCTWEPKREFDEHMGVLPSTYMFDEGYPTVMIDTERNGNSFTWNFGPGHRSLHRDIRFQILVNRSLDETWSPLQTVSPLDEVKLRRLESVEVAVKGPHVCEFTWRSPVSRNSLFDISTIELEYNMTLMANGKNKVYRWKRPSYQSAWTLHDLTPNTAYTYRFSVRPNGRGYMSDPVSGFFRTPEDVPSASPTLYEGGYFVNGDVDDKNTSQSITIYWKKIAEDEENGQITHHKILVKRLHSDPGSNSTETVISPGNNQEGEVTVMKKFSYNIRVLACNSVGCHGEHPRSRSTIFDKNQMSLPPYARNANVTKFVVIEEEKTVLQVRWKSEKADGADIFWQNTNTQRGLESSGHIKTKPGQLQNYSIVLPPGSQYTHYKVGLSVSEGHDHTGITWANCIYVAKGYIAVPEIQSLEQDSEHGSLKLKWKLPRCTAGMVYPTKFIIYYCLADTDSPSKPCKGTEETIIVSEETFSLLLTGLSQGETYRIWMKSGSGDNKSHMTEVLYKETSQHWLTSGVLAAFVSVSIPLGIVALFGILCLCKKFRKVKNYYLDPEIETLPEVPPDMKGYDNYVVSKQMSMDSTDSGVSSVSGWHREHLNSIGSEADSVFSNDHCPTCGSKKTPPLPVVREESFENSGSSLDGLQTYITTPPQPPNGYLAPITDDRNDDRRNRGQLTSEQQQNTSWDSLDKDGSISAYAQINGTGSSMDNLRVKTLNPNGYIPNDMNQTSHLHGLDTPRSGQAAEMLQNKTQKKHDNLQFPGYVDHQNFNKPEISLNRYCPNPDVRATRSPVQDSNSKNAAGSSVEMTSLKPVQTDVYVDECGRPVVSGLVSAGGYVDENCQPVSRQVTTVTCSDPEDGGYIPHTEMSEATAFKPGNENKGGAMFNKGQVTAEEMSKDDDITVQKEVRINTNQPDGYVLENDLESMCDIDPQKHARYIPDSSQNVGEVLNPEHAEEENSGEETCGGTKREIPPEGKTFKEFEDRGYVGLAANGDILSAKAQIETTLSKQEPTNQSVQVQESVSQRGQEPKLVNQAEQRPVKDNHGLEGQEQGSRLHENDKDSGMLVGQGYITEDTIMLTNDDDDLLSRSQPENSVSQPDDMNYAGYIDCDTMAQLGQKYCPFPDSTEKNTQFSGSQKGGQLSIDVKGNDGDTESDDSGICSPVVHDSVKFPEHTQQEKLGDGYVTHDAIV